MKALLVIDVPADYIGKEVDVTVQKVGWRISFGSRCRIKQMPKKKEEACQFMEESLMNAGWNACLEELEK